MPAVFTVVKAHRLELAAILQTMKLFDPGPMDRSTSLGLLLLRLGAGGLMISHGIPKIAKFGQLQGQFPDPLGIGHLASLVSAIGTEVGLAALVIVGFGTRIAALPIVFTMAVAAFVVHGGDPWANKELAVVYGIVFIVLFFTGAGRYSIDGRRASPG